MDILSFDIFAKEEFSIFAAFLLGIVSTFDPCPLSLNVTAVSYLSSELSNKREVWFRGGVYALGRMVMFGMLSFLIILGVDSLAIGDVLSRYGEKFVGIVLVVVGFLMLDFVHFHLHFPQMTSFSKNDSRVHAYINSFAMGALFALVICPHTLLYLGFLVPLDANMEHAHTIIISSSFALGGGVPVILLSALFSYFVSNIGRFYHRIAFFEKCLRMATAVIFILVGLYFIYENFL